MQYDILHKASDALMLKYGLELSEFVIAGGAPRDISLGIPFKDIDIFINMDPDEANEIFKEELPEEDDEEPFLVFPTNHHEYGEGPISAVYDIDLPGIDHPVQIINDSRIITQDLTSIWDVFDVGICMISYDYEANYTVRGNRFTNDVVHKRLTVYGKLNQGHIMRLKVKFPGWVVVNPAFIPDDFWGSLKKAKVIGESYEDLDL